MENTNKKKESGRRVFACRVDNATPGVIESIAFEFGCYRVCPHTRELVGAAGVMMDRIAAGQLSIVKTQNTEETQ